MAIVKWTSGDTITEREANDFSIRKGSETDIGLIGSADREDGSILYNSTNFCPQFYFDAANDDRCNLKILLGADGNVASQTGTTPLQVKAISYIKDILGFSGNVITVVAELKSSDTGDFAHLRVRKDGAGGDTLDLTTNSTDYVIVKGTFDISGDSAGRHTLEFFIDDGSGDTVDQRELEVYGV